MASIIGRVTLDERLDCEQAFVIIRVFDASFIDAPGRLIAEAAFSVPCQKTDSIPFEIPLDAAASLTGARLTIAAEIRTGDPARLGAGDWVTARSIALRKQEIEADAPVIVPVQRILDAN